MRLPAGSPSQRIDTLESLGIRSQYDLNAYLRNFVHDELQTTLIGKGDQLARTIKPGNSGAALMSTPNVLNNSIVESTWVDDSGWQVPAYAAGWSDYAAPYGPVRYRKLPDGMVIIEGLAQSPAGLASVTLFTLPVGYRPGVQMLYRRDLNGNWVRVDISTGGAVFLVGWAAAVPYISLESMIFMAEG